ncbi:uncharacterized protein LOC125561148 [Nematostella vectensis]|uniref:uncharacterized protein LOC125561148 n=1 Tax=Nematostella vectensis TaxID=45351 RepID=UPI0020779068|nr:uncharacterized protein LOC125561148 [Nematostella vectensis]
MSTKKTNKSDLASQKVRPTDSQMQGKHSSANKVPDPGRTGRPMDTTKRRHVTQTTILKPLASKPKEAVGDLLRSSGQSIAHSKRGRTHEPLVLGPLKVPATKQHVNRETRQQTNFPVTSKALSRAEASQISDLFKEAVKPKANPRAGLLHIDKRASGVRTSPVGGVEYSSGGLPRRHKDHKKAKGNRNVQRSPRPLGPPSIHVEESTGLCLPEITMEEVLQSWDVKPRRSRSSSNVGIKDPMEFLKSQSDNRHGHSPVPDAPSYEELLKCRYLRLGQEEEEERLAHGTFCSCNSCEHSEGLKNSPYLNA